MTIEEMSNEFDVLYNNISSNEAPGLNEYEKSVLLTKAQNEVVKNYFNPKGNKYTEGFDGNQKRQIDFSSIVRTTKLELLDEDPKIDSRGLVYKFPAGLLCVINESFVDDNGVRYSITPLSFEEYQRVLMKPYAYPPKKCIWRLISEPTSGGTGTWWFTIKSRDSATLTRRQAFTYTNYSDKPVVVSMTFSGTVIGIGSAPDIVETDNEITVTMTVPLSNGVSASVYWNRFIRDNEELKKYIDFGFPNLTASDLGGNSSVTVSFTAGVAGSTNKVELVGRTNGMPELGKYMCRYVKKPRPIILVDLDVDDYTVSVDGEVKAQSCELPEELQPEILQRAVELAKTAYEGDLKTTIETGQRSE